MNKDTQNKKKTQESDKENKLARNTSIIDQLFYAGKLNKDFDGLEDHYYKIHKSKLESCIVDPFAPIIPPIALIEYKNTKICTFENFSLIIGPKKSRKTFLTIAIAAAALSGKSSIEGLNGNMPENSMLYYINTEQSRSDFQLVVKRIRNQVGDDVIKRVLFLDLKSYSTSKRVGIIESVISIADTKFFMIIDGLRDLIKSINSEEEATEIMTKLLQWTDKKICHIMLVLHMNKTDDNARGHIGTEAINKAETVLSVKKEKSNSNISLVAPAACRGEEFEPFGFQINLEGSPELEIIEPSKVRLHEKIHENLVHILKDGKKLPYMMLIKEYTEVGECQNLLQRDI